MLGVLNTDVARRQAMDLGLDLVEVSPNAKPPVCRIMDYGKFQYDESQKLKKTRKTQQNHALKEVKFRANTEEHDYMTKLNRVIKFLDKGHKVKISLMFRGRENAHRELGFEQVKRVLKECEEVANVEMEPKLVGRCVVSMLAPISAKK